MSFVTLHDGVLKQDSNWYNIRWYEDNYSQKREFKIEEGKGLVCLQIVNSIYTSLNHTYNFSLMLLINDCGS